jgi:hypothetical protein
MLALHVVQVTLSRHLLSFPRFGKPKDVGWQTYLYSSNPELEAHGQIERDSLIRCKFVVRDYIWFTRARRLTRYCKYFVSMAASSELIAHVDRVCGIIQAIYRRQSQAFIKQVPDFIGECTDPVNAHPQKILLNRFKNIIS